MTAPLIAIIGAGPCGLTLARLLECMGINYIVYEREESPNSNLTGGSLDIHGDTGQLALRECGLFDKFTQMARYADTVFTITDKGGEGFLEIGQGRDAPEIDRTALRQILLDSVPGDKIMWGHALKSVTAGNDNRPLLRFANESVQSGFELVVGADGAWSKVRSTVTQATPRYTGKSFIVSAIGCTNPLYETIALKVRAGSSLSIGSGKYIMIQRQGDGSYRISFGLGVPEGFFRSSSVNLEDSTATRGLLLHFYADWADEFKDLVRHSTDFRAWPLYSMLPEDMSWESVPGVTLAGDAAHLAYPGGEGVNVAMTDSLALALKISEHGVNNIARAVQEYEADMFPRAIAVITESKAMEKAMYSDDPRAFVHLVCN